MEETLNGPGEIGFFEDPFDAGALDEGLIAQIEPKNEFLPHRGYDRALVDMPSEYPSSDREISLNTNLDDALGTPSTLIRMLPAKQQLTMLEKSFGMEKYEFLAWYNHKRPDLQKQLRPLYQFVLNEHLNELSNIVLDRAQTMELFRHEGFRTIPADMDQAPELSWDDLDV